MVDTHKITRGIKNNNPGNIDRNETKWQGMNPDQSGDKRFVVFLEPKWGIRAMARILQNYAKGNIDTVTEIVSKWAPPVENNTQSYINAVDAMVDGDANTELDDKNKRIPNHIMVELLAAIITHENGYCPYNAVQLWEGAELA